MSSVGLGREDNMCVIVGSTKVLITVIFTKGIRFLHFHMFKRFFIFEILGNILMSVILLNWVLNVIPSAVKFLSIAPWLCPVVRFCVCGSLSYLRSMILATA
jgi:hypothetical protein